MDVVSLKTYIYQNRKVEYLLDRIGCGKIKFHNNGDKSYYSATRSDGDNPMGVVIYDSEYLNYCSFSRNEGFDKRMDLLSLIEEEKHMSFSDTIKYIHKELGLEYKWNETKIKKKKEKTINEILYPLLKYKYDKVNVGDVTFLDDEILNDYVPILYYEWYKEGIMPWTAKKFGIAYSYRRNRIIVPHKYWLTGQLVGINARTTVADADSLGIKKYYITPTYKKSLNLFGLWQNKDVIQKTGRVIVYESEKSVLKRDSLLDSTGVALSGHIISDVQVRILKGLGVEIIIAMDKDINLNEVRFMCEKFYGYNVSYIYDRWDLLGAKDSPADVCNQKFKYLLKHRVKYDEEERKKLQNYLKDGDDMNVKLRN